jgi:signal transduction histidine kinase
MRVPGFLNLGGISGQIAALVMVSVIMLHLITAAIFFGYRLDQPAPPPEDGHGQFFTAAQLLGTTPAAERPRLLSEIARAFPRMGIEQLASASVPPANGAVDSGPHPPPRLGAGYRVFALDAKRIGIVLPDGEAIAAKVSRGPGRGLGRGPGPGPFWGGPLAMTLLFAVISVTLLGVWAARALAGPLSSFARAAESFSLNGTSTTLPEQGPAEIRAVARALNRMRQRITALIDDRTRMLAAISHDLRTPITRMRLRTEFIKDETNRARMLSDLDQMLSMLESVLSFLRDGRRLEAMTLTDVASILQLVVDQFADMGHRVNYVGPRHAMAMARPDDLARGITNLVENAVRFGSDVVLGLTMTGERITIDVADDGPGISDSHKAAMLEPFVRGDGARNMDDATGFGLGLAIAQAIALAHGGELSLHDREPHGLVARLRFPLGPQRERHAA